MAHQAGMYFLTGVFFAMLGCDSSPDETSVSHFLPGKADAGAVLELVAQLKRELVWVEGGVFIMGDYGKDYGTKAGYIDIQQSSKPAHEVELSSYSMSKFKITNRAYQIYLAANDLPLRQDLNDRLEAFVRVPDLPATVDWFEAQRFCSWLADQSGLPFSLPTEAQWEYAARSRGEFVPVATNTGDWQDYQVAPMGSDDDGVRGVNISTFWSRTEYAKSQGWRNSVFTLIPVGSYPPNKHGFDSMTDNGFEWVSDWYDPDYYSYSPRLDPKGPPHPVVPYGFGTDLYMKVLRGDDYSPSTWRFGVTVRRSYDNPLALLKASEQHEGYISLGGRTARCAVNSPHPIVAAPNLHGVGTAEVYGEANTLSGSRHRIVKREPAATHNATVRIKGSVEEAQPKYEHDPTWSMRCGIAAELHSPPWGAQRGTGAQEESRKTGSYLRVLGASNNIFMKVALGIEPKCDSACCLDGFSDVVRRSV